MTGTPDPRSSTRTTLRRLAIGIFLGLPALGLGILLPMQASGQSFVPASASSSPGQANLFLGQTDNPEPVTEGEDITYSITVGNAGVGDATNVLLTDFVSSDVDFVSATPSQGTCAPPEGSFQCDLGTIGVEDTVTVDVVVTSTDRCGSGSFSSFALSEPCTVSNEVQVSSPDDFNSPSDTEDTTVNPASGAHLTLDKSDSPDPVQELNPITYTLHVANDGVANASDVTLTDTLPAGEVFNSASTTQGSCTHAGATVTCDLGTVAFQSEGPDHTVTVTITAQAPNVSGDTTVTNNAEVTGSNANTADASADTLVQVNDTGSTSGTVPPGTTAPLTFTTASQAKGNGGAAVNGGDPSAVAIVIPPGGPGGSVSLNELPCAAAPCTGTGPQPTAAVVLGNVVFDIEPPANYPGNKPFRVVLLYDKSLHPTAGPVFYFKDGVTPTEIQLRQCGSPGPRGKAPCVAVSKKITSNNPLTNGDWKVIVKINSDPRMHK